MFEDDRLHDVSDILAAVGHCFQQFVNLLPLGHLEDRSLSLEQVGDGTPIQIICLVLQPIDLYADLFYPGESWQVPNGKPIWLAPLVFPLHLMQELLSRPLSLSMRLFGNIMGEDTIIAIFIGLSPFLLGLIP